MLLTLRKKKEAYDLLMDKLQKDVRGTLHFVIIFYFFILGICANGKDGAGKSCQGEGERRTGEEEEERGGGSRQENARGLV